MFPYHSVLWCQDNAYWEERSQLSFHDTQICIIYLLICQISCHSPSIYICIYIFKCVYIDGSVNSCSFLTVFLLINKPLFKFSTYKFMNISNLFSFYLFIIMHIYIFIYVYPFIIYIYTNDLFIFHTYESGRYFSHFQRLPVSTYFICLCCNPQH
jgi:hypothetical protein